MKQKLSILIIALSTFLYAEAYAFQSGDLYYKITSNSEPYTVEVTSGSYSGMTTITIPGTVTNGEQTYSVTSIGEAVFRGCSGLTSVTIPNSVTSIGYGAFAYCSGLTSVTIPISVTSISGYAFYGCRGLTSVTIPISVTSIGNCAFYGCSGMTSETIPNSVTSIGEAAFADCSGLTSIDVASDNSNFSSVDGVLFNKDKTILICCPAGKTSSYTIPNSVTSIGDRAFYDCSGLTSVIIPNSVTSIGYYAFRGCTGLTSVTIPNSVASIGRCAFAYCNSLNSVMVNWEESLLINSDVFDGLTLPNIKLYVPNSAIAKYKAADVWKKFNIIDNDEPTAIKAVEAESNKTIKTIKDGQIVIIRNGVMYDMQGRKL